MSFSGTERGLNWGWLAAGLLLVASPASATTLVLSEFSGRKAAVVQAKVAAALQRAGHDVTVNQSSGELTASIARRLAERQEASAVVEGTVSRLGQRSWQAVLLVRSGSTGQLLGEKLVFDDTWLPGLTRQLIDNSAERLKPLLTQSESSSSSSSSSPREAVSVAVPSVEDRALQASVESSSGAKNVGEDSTEASSVLEDGALFRLVARGGAVRRSLKFSDDIYGRLRTHSVNMGVYQLEGIIYPFTRPVGERLGLIASYEGGVSGVVVDTDFSREFRAEFQEFFVGLRARYPVDEHEVGFDLTYGQMQAGLEDVGGEANVPDASYSLVRTSLHGALNFGGLTTVVAAGFRLPLGYGEMSENTWFPRISGYGVEASAGVSYPITSRLMVEATGSLRRFVLEMNSEPEDAEGIGTEVAGGAIDLYLGAYLGLGYRL